MTDRTWTAQAACRNHPNPDLWFPAAEFEYDENGKNGRRVPSAVGADNLGREAKAICQQCPVRTECLTAAVSNNEQFGVHGGAGENLLRSLRRAWVLDGLWNGPVWSLALASHFRKLDGERVPVVNRNGPGATHGRRVTFARGCRCDACSLAASVDGVRVKVRDRRRRTVAA